MKIELAFRAPRNWFAFMLLIQIIVNHAVKKGKNGENDFDLQILNSLQMKNNFVLGVTVGQIHCTKN